MRILKIVGGSDGGGVFTSETTFIKHWISKGVSIDLIIIGNGLAADHYKELTKNVWEFNNLDIRFAGSFTDILKSLLKAERLSREVIKDCNLKAAYYDAVIFRRPIYIQIAGAVGKVAGTKVFWHLPNSITRVLGKLFYNLMISYYDIEPVANSQFTCKSIGRRCKHIVYPGFNRGRVIASKSNMRKLLNISPQAPVFGIAARITKAKAQDLVIKAFLKTGVFESGGHLIIAGVQDDTEFIKYCKSLSSPYEANVHFVGRLTDMSQFYSTIDVYINSRRDVEPFGISIAEAMAAGRPVLAYFRGGPSEMIEDTKNGWLVKEPSEDGYIAGIKKCLLQKDNWQEMGHYGLKLSEKYDSQRNAERFLSIILQAN